MQFKRLHVIANPAAGSDEAVLAELNRALGETNISWNVSVTQAYGDGAKLARKAIEDGADLIGVYGGDGTINDVLHGVYPSDIPIAILAGGTGNGAARALGIPRHIEGSVKHLKDGNSRRLKIDIGRVGDRLFLLRLDIGKIVEIVEEHERGFKKRLGIWSYIHALAESFTSPDESDISINTYTEKFQTQASAIMVLNMSHLDQTQSDFTTDIQPDDGLLDLFLVRSNIADAAKAAAAMIRVQRFEDLFESYHADQFVIETETPMAVLADGEPCGQTPIEVELISQAVTLLVPNTE